MLIITSEGVGPVVKKKRWLCIVNTISLYLPKAFRYYLNIEKNTVVSRNKWSKMFVSLLQLLKIIR